MRKKNWRDAAETMGLIHADITMKNHNRPKGRAVKVRALVDSGSVNLCIPEKLRAQLKLEMLETRIVTVADGSCRAVPYVAPVEVRFKNRVTVTGALVMGDETLLGAIPMEDMDVVILPKPQRLEVNPKNPLVAGSIAKKAGVSA